MIVDFMGGGACWDEECLSAESTTFQSMSSALSTVDGQTSSSANYLLEAAGISAFPLDAASPLGSTSSYTYIFVPYCTQDIHLGTCERTYTHPLSGESRTLRHCGASNTRAVMLWLYANFPAASNPPETLTFMGCSAGAAAVIVTEAMR